MTGRPEGRASRRRPGASPAGRARSGRGVALAALLPVALAAGACDVPGVDTGWSLERMVDQPKLDAYERAPAFPDSAAMRVPPVGTVSRDAVLDPRIARGEDAAGGHVEGIPLELTIEDLRTGRERYGIYCAVCHGEDANAGTPVAAAMPLRPPPSLHAPRLVEAPVSHLYHVAAEGYGLMPAYREELEPGELWAVAAYVRALQLSRGVPLSRLEPARRDSVLRALEGVEAGTDAGTDAGTGGGP